VLKKNLILSQQIGRQKTAERLAQERPLSKDSERSRNLSFSGIFRACLEEGKKTGLTAQDYLSNPVVVRSAPCSKTFQRRVERSSVKTREPAKKQDPQPTDVSPKGKQKEVKASLKDTVSQKIEKSIENAAQKYSLPPELIRGVIQAESGFRVDAISSAGARGLMQLMPATASDLGVEDPFDIDQNIDGGSRYLRSMLDRFGNDLNKALAAYNAGPGTVERYNGTVPYQETRHYVKRVREYSQMTA